MKRVIRKRVWGGDNASARDVGENMRDVQSAVSSVVPMQIVTLENFVYHNVDVELATKPLAVLVIHVENLDGTIERPDPLTDWRWDGRSVSLTIGGLPTGRRYATIRLLVIS